MTPEQSREDQASEVPLYERLRSIPADLRVTIPIQWAEDGAETGHRFIPIGNMAHRAAATVLEVERLKIAEQIILASIPEEYLADTVAGSAQNYIAHLEKRAERAERRAEEQFKAGREAGMREAVALCNERMESVVTVGVLGVREAILSAIGGGK